MAKIKEIIITDFRAYEGTHRFNFQLKDNLANLIMIYAPNGFGKTSFFDAVEWAYVNRLRRFEHRVSREEIEQRDYSSDDRILLTNRTAAKSGKKGNIKIILDDDKFIQREVKPRQSKEKYSFDYRKTKLGGNFNEKELSGLPENNILTQDQIDAFLRFTTSDEKFTALKDFWPQGTEATNLFRTLTQCQRVTDLALDTTKKEIGRIKKRIGELVNLDTNFKNVNGWITGLNATRLMNISFIPLSTNVTEEVYRTTVNLNETYKQLVAAELEKLRLKIVRLNDMIAGYAAYLAALEKIKASVAGIESLKKVQADYNNLNYTSENLNSITLTVRKLTSQINELNSLAAGWDQFQADQRQAGALRLKIEEDRNRNETLMEESQVFENSLSSLSYGLTDIKNDLEEEKLLNDKVELNVTEIIKLNKDVADGNERLGSLEITLAEYDQELNRKLLRRLQLQQLNNLDDVEPGVYDEHIDSLLELLNKQQADLVSLKAQIAEVKSRQQLNASFNDGLERILKWGVNQVSALSLHSCPMCQTEFDDVEALLQAIQAGKPDILRLNTLEEEINYLSLVEIDMLEAIRYIECQIVEYCQIEEGINETNIQEYQLNKALMAEQQHQSMQHVNFARNTIEQLSRIFTNPAELNLAIATNDYTPIKTASNNRLAAIIDRIARVEQVIEWKQSSLQRVQNELLNSRNTIESNQNRIQIIQNSERYQLLENLLEKYELQSEGLSITEIQAMSAALEKELQKEQLNLDETSQFRAVLISKTAGYAADLSATAVNGTLLGQQNTLEELTLLKEKYETDYQLIMSDQVVSDEALISAASSAADLVDGFEALSTQLLKFGIDLAVVQEGLEKNGLNVKLAEKSAHEKQLKITKSKIDAAKNRSGEYIKNGIENYFNKEAINNIYSKIDPHPRFTEIDFKPDMSDKIPKLQIMAKSNQEQLNPNLFFSTGQINVLSLSIFLAKACELGSQKVSTIFMDDPVQNLSDINVLSFIDLLRTLIMGEDKQIVISTHDEKFFNLVKSKLADRYYPTKFVELESYGKIREVVVG